MSSKSCLLQCVATAAPPPLDPVAMWLFSSGFYTQIQHCRAKKHHHSFYDSLFIIREELFPEAARRPPLTHYRSERQHRRVPKTRAGKENRSPLISSGSSRFTALVWEKFQTLLSIWPHVSAQTWVLGQGGSKRCLCLCTMVPVKVLLCKGCCKAGTCQNRSPELLGSNRQGGNTHFLRIDNNDS